MEQKPEDLQVSQHSLDTLASEEIHPLMELAVEMRQRVADQLTKIPPTGFSGVQCGFWLTR